MRFLYFLFLLLSLSACQKQKSSLFIQKNPADTGIYFSNTTASSTDLNILNYLYFYNGAGVSTADFNNDGLTDLYFTSNLGEDKFYLNAGGLNFEDVTQPSNLQNNTGWTTGVTHVDINNDGLLDLYVCKVGDYRNLNGHNLLLVNQGVNKEGIPKFMEQSQAYGLDFSGFSTQAAFFDYDLDGDLDLYLLNHSVHPNRTYGKGSKRKQYDAKSGDILYRNDDGKFIEVSEEAGIYQGKIGYGLGLAISDINNDGYPDIYIGNDFYENDYLYLNQQDGSFSEIISQNNPLGHTSHYSMGNATADINNDGLTDILSLDMLPEDLTTYKTSGLEYAYPIYNQYLKNGYSHQFMQNTLHLNQGVSGFSEIATLSGVEATEWSWGALVADLDNDSHKDIFISNGIKGATNDMDFINFIANDEIQKRLYTKMTERDMAFIEKIPQKKVPNYFYQNNGDLTFSDVTDAWFKKINSFSNGASCADLDNDGDLDLVVNNVDEPAFLLENTLQQNNSIQIKLKGPEKNRFGIGAKIIAYHGTTATSYENFVTRGYLSASDINPLIGTGKDSILDSLTVIWPGGKHQTLKQLPTAQNLTLSYTAAEGDYYSQQTKATPLFEVRPLLDFIHKEQPSLDFNREPLIPFAHSNEGPSVSVTDFNLDQNTDIFFGGAKGQASALYQQLEGQTFEKSQEVIFEIDKISEDVSHTFFNANGDIYPDLIVISAGNEFIKGKALTPRLYLNKEGNYYKSDTAFADLPIHASKVAAIDLENDGDMDLCITSNAVPHRFGEASKQYLFENDGKGNFTNITSTYSKPFENAGNIKDFQWVDIDGNGFKDLIAVGHWNPIQLFLNNGKTLHKMEVSGLENTNGWWNTIEVADMDQDGDLDLIAGNWGLNTKFTPSPEEPVRLYRTDFDDNGSVEPIITYYHEHTETPFASKDELAKQMPFLNKQFLSYSSFAAASLKELFGKKKLDNALKREVFMLETAYFENNGDSSFTKKELPLITQASSVQDIALHDVDEDGFQDVILVGNTYEISTQLGRLDASHGLILKNDGDGNFSFLTNLNINGAARKIEKIKIGNTTELVVTRNNDTPVFLKKLRN